MCLRSHSWWDSQISSQHLSELRAKPLLDSTSQNIFYAKQGCLLSLPQSTGTIS